MSETMPLESDSSEDRDLFCQLCNQRIPERMKPFHIQKRETKEGRVFYVERTSRSSSRMPESEVLEEYYPICLRCAMPLKYQAQPRGVEIRANSQVPVTRNFQASENTPDSPRILQSFKRKFRGRFAASQRLNSEKFDSEISDVTGENEGFS